jgi:hypothetical protein
MYSLTCMKAAFRLPPSGAVVKFSLPYSAELYGVSMSIPPRSGIQPGLVVVSTMYRGSQKETGVPIARLLAQIQIGDPLTPVS